MNYTVSKKKHWTEDQRMAGTQSLIGWKRLAVFLKVAGEIRPQEEVVGFTVERTGIVVHLELHNNEE